MCICICYVYVIIYIIVLLFMYVVYEFFYPPSFFENGARLVWWILGFTEKEWNKKMHHSITIIISHRTPTHPGTVPVPVRYR